MGTAVIENATLAAEAVAGLAAHPKTLSPKWFYDAAGSALFERITEVEEYYPTRTEQAILSAELRRIAAFVPDGAALVELGSGASVKTRLLLDGLPALSAYVPIDISEEFLLSTASALQADYPGLTVRPVVADFMAPVTLPDLGAAPVVGFFPGSTIGNLDPSGAAGLLRRLRAWPEHGALILGVDLVKEAGVLEAAYDDAAGVTAAFNKNLLVRLNREAGAKFDSAAFAHRAVWNAPAARVEMHLVSLRAQNVEVAGRKIRFAEGETIHTENSHKFTEASLTALAAEAGWRVAAFLTDAEALFGVAVLQPG